MPKSSITVAYTKDIASELAEKLQITKVKANEYVNETINIIAGNLLAGNKVSIQEIGIFTVKDVKERNCRNPKTGGTIVSPAHKKLTFKPGKQIKNRLN